MTRMIMMVMVSLALGAGTALAQGSAPAGAPPAPSAAAAPINLNTATQPQLEALPGIGPAIAQRILEYRQEIGGFKKVEELMNVRGVGEAMFLRLKPLVTITAPQTDRAAAERP